MPGRRGTRSGHRWTARCRLWRFRVMSLRTISEAMSRLHISIMFLGLLATWTDDVAQPNTPVIQVGVKDAGKCLDFDAPGSQFQNNLTVWAIDALQVEFPFFRFSRFSKGDAAKMDKIDLIIDARTSKATIQF